MEVTVEKHFGKWGIAIVQGYQRFHLPHGNTKADAEWMARVFRIAIENHNKEFLKEFLLAKEEMNGLAAGITEMNAGETRSISEIRSALKTKKESKWVHRSGTLACFVLLWRIITRNFF